MCLYDASNGQVADRSTYGNDFFIGVIRAPVWSLDNVDQLYISTLSTQLVNFTIYTEEIELNYTESVSFDQPITVLLPSYLQPLSANYSERNKGIHVHSDAPISVTVMVIEYDFRESYLVYPYADLGQQRYEYYVVSADRSINSWTETRSQFLLVGNENSTTITIAPTQSIEIPMDPQDPNSALVLVAPGSAHTVVLHRMQTLLIGTSIGDDLTGTAIISDKPLTVISGHECGTLSDQLIEEFDQAQWWWWWWWGIWCDHFIEQIPPTVTWGKTFLIVPFPDESVQHYNKIIASAHATTVTQTCNGSVVATIQLASPGDWNSREWNITYDPGAYCVIESNEPILVMQFSAEGHIENYFDVNASIIFSQVMSIVPPVEQYINAVLYFPNENITHLGYNYENHYAHITTNDKSSVLLDDLPYNWNWHPIYDQDGKTVGYGTIHKFPDTNPHVLRHTNPSSGLSVIAYGSNFNEPSDNPQSNAFLMGMKLNVLETG